MGLFSSSSSSNQPAAPLERPAPFLVGVNPNYARHDQQIVLKLKEKKLSLSGDDFYIYDAFDQPFLQCKAKVFSLHHKKEFRDIQGNLLFTLVKKILAIHTTFEAIAPDEQTVLFTVKSGWSIGSAKLNTTFTNVDGQELTLALRGDFFDRKASINLGSKDGPTIASIGRSFLNARQLIFDKQTYYLTVAPGVDAAMMAAICVCLDEKENERETA